MKRHRMSLYTALFALGVATLWAFFSPGHSVVWVAITLVWLTISAYQWTVRDPLTNDPTRLSRRIARLLFFWT